MGYAKRGRKRSPRVDAMAAEVAAGISMTIVAKRHGVSLPALSQAIARRRSETAPPRNKGAPRKVNYTQVSAMVSDGYCTKEVAYTFGVSVGTVRRIWRQHEHVY